MSLSKEISKLYSEGSIRALSGDRKLESFFVRLALMYSTVSEFGVSRDFCVSGEKTSIITSAIRDFQIARQTFEFLFYLIPLSLRDSDNIESYLSIDGYKKHSIKHKVIPVLDSAKYVAALCNKIVSENKELSEHADVIKYFFSDNFSSLFNLCLLDRRVSNTEPYIRGSLPSRSNYLTFKVRPDGSYDDNIHLYLVNTESAQMFFGNQLHLGEWNSDYNIILEHICGPRIYPYVSFLDANSDLLSIEAADTILSLISIFSGSLYSEPEFKLLVRKPHKFAELCEVISKYLFSERLFNDITYRIFMLFQSCSHYLYRNFVKPALYLRDKYILPTLYAAYNEFGIIKSGIEPSPLILYLLLFLAYYVYILRNDSSRIILGTVNNYKIISLFDLFSFIDEHMPVDEIFDFILNGFQIADDKFLPSAPSSITGNSDEEEFVSYVFGSELCGPIESLRFLK